MNDGIPDREGVWRCGDQEIEVYSLEPVGGTLCVWGPEVGISYTGAADNQLVWDTDEWQGHIPVFWYCDEKWEFVCQPNNPTDEETKG